LFLAKDFVSETKHELTHRSRHAIPNRRYVPYDVPSRIPTGEPLVSQSGEGTVPLLRIVLTLESSGADSSGPSRAALEISAAMMFGPLGTARRGVDVVLA